METELSRRTKTRREVFILFAILAVFPLRGTGDTEKFSADRADQLHVGGQMIRVPLPTGFHRIDGIHPEFDRFLQATEPETNRLKAFYAREEDLGDLLRNEWSAIEALFNVQTIQEFESFIGKPDFSESLNYFRNEITTLSETLRTQISEYEEKASDTLSELLDDLVLIETTEMIPLGVDHESSDFLLYSGFLQTKFAFGEEGWYTEQSLQAMTGGFLHVNNRMILIYHHVPYNTHTDLERARENLKQWAESIVAANRSHVSGESSIVRSDIDRTGDAFARGVLRAFGYIALFAVIMGILAICRRCARTGTNDSGE